MIIEVKQDVERVKFGSLQLGATFRLQASANISDLWLKITTRPPAGAVGVRVLGEDDVNVVSLTNNRTSLFSEDALVVFVKAKVVTED